MVREKKEIGGKNSRDASCLRKKTIASIFDARSNAFRRRRREGRRSWLHVHASNAIKTEMFCSFEEAIQT